MEMLKAKAGTVHRPDLQWFQPRRRPAGSSAGDRSCLTEGCTPSFGPASNQLYTAVAPSLTKTSMRSGTHACDTGRHCRRTPGRSRRSRSRLGPRPRCAQASPLALRRSSSPNVPLPLNSASISAQSVATPSATNVFSNPVPGNIRMAPRSVSNSGAGRCCR